MQQQNPQTERRKCYMKRRIGILTSGGDCPGLNAAIRGVNERGFFGCNHFRMANEYLVAHGIAPVKW